MDFDALKRIAKAIAIHMGSNCEVTVHDLTRDYENTIIAIENGHVTGRKIGDGASELVMKALHMGENIEDHYAYFTRTADGRELKSSSVFIRNQKGKPYAVLSINYDISQLKIAEKVLKELTETVVATAAEPSEDEPVTIPNSVTDLLDVLIEEAYQMIGKPVALMTREDKVRAIRYLEQRGALLIKKSGDKISRFFDISKYTLYGYLASDDTSQ